MDEIQQLKQRIQELEDIIYKDKFSGRDIFKKDVQFLNKFGAFGVEPVSQQSHIANPSGGLTIDAEARTEIIAILVVLENLGFKNTS